MLEAERKTIQHSGGYTKFNQGKRPNFNNGPRSHKGKGRGFGGQANNRGNTGVCFVVTLGYVTHVISRDIFQGFVPKTSGITNGVTRRVIHRSGWKMSLVSPAV